VRLRNCYIESNSKLFKTLEAYALKCVFYPRTQILEGYTDIVALDVGDKYKLMERVKRLICSQR
jgi:hypothetical protein